MRIVDRKTFLSLPPGAVFATYEPCVFGEWRIKGDSLMHPGTESLGDFIADELVSTTPAESTDCRTRFQVLDEMAAGRSVMMESCYGRDGAFVPDQLFAVLEASDLAMLRKVLTEQALDPFIPSTAPAALSPVEAARQMQEAAKKEEPDNHLAGDALLLKIARENGYDEASRIFDDMPKWYE